MVNSGEIKWSKNVACTALADARHRQPSDGNAIPGAHDYGNLAGFFGLTFVSRPFLYKLQFIAVSVLSYTFTNFCISSALEPITFSRSIDTWAVFRNSKTGSFSP